MNGEIDWRELFLSSHGRLARTPFLIAAAILIAVTALYEVIFGSTVHWVTGWFVYPPLLWFAACVLSKRLHDRGRSGWWAALVLFAMVSAWPHTPGFFDFIFGLVLIWAVVELALMKGEQGANRYGPNPMKSAAVA